MTISRNNVRRKSYAAVRVVEVSRAHRGMLLRDELPGFRRHVPEVPRQRLEEGLT
jgi:predicted ATPase with chaperone activity